MERWPRGSVVVATDLSEGADEAIRQADAWAKRAGLPLLAVHALPDLSPLLPRATSMHPATIRDRAVESVRERVQKLTERPTNDFEVVVEPGSAHGVTIDVAESAEAALVVVGTSSKSALGRLLLGATAEQVARHAHAAVLVARRSPVSGVIMAATDLSDRALVPLRAAAEEARRRSARVIALHCIETTHPALLAFEPGLVLDAGTLATMRATCEEVLKAQLDSAGAEGSAEVVEGSAATAIARAARADGAELLVVGTHGRTGLKRVALGSVAEALAREAPCSVLIVRSG
jgi:nucleotide-binding universal stress UspA family protein